jgi:cbb3-type cytochrome oxidase subunit 3
MTMSDLISSLDLSTYPQVALVIFLLAFMTVLLRVFRRSCKKEYLRAAMLPVDDRAEPAPPGGDA